MERKLKIYLDTSVINFLFSEQSPEKREITLDFFENYISSYEVYISDFVIYEIENTTNEIKKAILISAIEKYKLTIYDKSNQDIIDLANIYITNNIIPQKKFDDALHIASATIAKADVLVSWNFKHIVNLRRIQIYNSVNLMNGYSIIEIRNPREVL